MDTLEKDKLKTLLDWSDEKLLYVRKGMSLLKILDDSYELEDTIVNLFSVLLSVVPLKQRTYRISTIIRSRLNEKDEFTKESELSYIRDNSKVKKGRFNKEGHPMFYGTIECTDGINSSVSSCLESCKGLMSETNGRGNIDITFGVWKIVNPFNVVDITFIEDNPFNELLEFNHSKHEFRKDVLDEIIEFWKFISNLGCNKPTSSLQYTLSNLLLDTIKEKFYESNFVDIQLDGILYPSSETDRKGTNIVLYPESVDRTLHLEEVGIYRFERVSNDGNYVIYRLGDEVPVIDSSFVIQRYDNEKLSQVRQQIIDK